MNYLIGHNLQIVGGDRGEREREVEGVVRKKVQKSRESYTRAFRTRPFRRTRTQTEVRNSDSDSGSDLRNRDFPTP
jgi:hypothetical protein